MSASAHVHRIRWYGMPGRVPRNRLMAGRDWGWDVVCSCGWESRTGGAIQERIREAIADHRFETRPDKSSIWPNWHGATWEDRQNMAEALGEVVS